MENMVLMAVITKASTKGIFVQTYIERLRQEKGDGAAQELERRVGRPLLFRRLEDVPVALEVVVLGHIYDLLNEGHALSGRARERAAGRLHMALFIETTLGSTLYRSMPHTSKTFRTMLCNIGSIARGAIKNAEFRSVEVPGGVQVTLKHTDYPLEHFAGFFEEWMERWEMTPDIRMKVKSLGVHEYTIRIQ